MTTISRPLIQVQGYVSETLGSFTYDLANAAGTVTNQPVFITGAQADTNLMKFTTNSFQAYDVALTNGLNTLTLRATDLAGNVATTNLTLTLDYTGATNPPTITIVWPAPNTLVAGASFTLRGSLNDDSASVSVSDSSGNIVPGLVERGGGFSVANLALPAATNTFVVSATNAAGYGSSQSVTVLQSPVSVTVDPLVAGQASQPFVTVTGTVSAGGYDVWVNGVQASVNTNDTWEAGGVPNLSKSGSGEFDVSVYPAGSDPATTPSSGDQFVPVLLPPVVQLAGFINSITLLSQSLCCGNFNGFSISVNQTWQIGIGGQSNYFALLDGRPSTLSTSLPGDVPPVVDWQNASFDSASSASLPATDMCCGGTGVSEAGQYTQSQIQLVAAGPASPGVMQLIHLIAWAQVGDNGDPATANSIQLYGQALQPTATNAAVGEAYVIVPAGSTQTIPVTILGSTNSTFTVQAEPVSVTIFANGIDLSTNTPEFCVGEQVTNQIVFNPPMPASVSVQYNWVMQPDYVNSIIPPATTNASPTYTLDPTLKTNSTTSLWWTDGGQKLVGCFVNIPTIPQPATISPHYFASIYRPSATFTDSPPSWITNVVINGVLSVSLGNGYAGDMNYQVTVSSEYSGTADITQLVNRQAVTGSITQGGTSTSGQFWLDNHRFYTSQSDGPDGGIQVPANNSRQIFFGDGPSWPLIASVFGFTSSVSDQFKDYVVFRPDVGSKESNIYVTLEVVSGSQSNSWSWSASNTWSGSWSAPLGTNIVRPTAPDSSDGIPTWPNTYTNP